MPRSREQGLQTREKILDVAQELFTEQGYDKTSLRDISARLGITKAALYYYFPRKEAILLELHLRLHEVGREMLDELEALEDGPERVAAWPLMVQRLIAAMSENRELILLHYRNHNAFEALHDDPRNQLENEDLERRFNRILSSPAIPLQQRVRMACSIGAVTEIFGDSAPAFVDVPFDELAGLLRVAVDDLLAIPAKGRARSAPRLDPVGSRPPRRRRAAPSAD